MKSLSMKDLLRKHTLLLLACVFALVLTNVGVSETLKNTSKLSEKSQLGGPVRLLWDSSIGQQVEIEAPLLVATVDDSKHVFSVNLTSHSINDEKAVLSYDVSLTANGSRINGTYQLECTLFRAGQYDLLICQTQFEFSKPLKLDLSVQHLLSVDGRPANVVMPERGESSERMSLKKFLSHFSLWPKLLIIPSFPWWMNILSFESVDSTNRVARTTIPGTDQLCPMVSYSRRGFETTAWIENVPEGMRQPGTWMVNTVKGKIYYWPADGEPGEDIYAPALRELVRVEGVNDSKGNGDVPVRGIAFYNLNFILADRGVWDADDAGIQHDWEMLDKDNAMLRFRGAEHCRVDQCHFYNAGGNAIRLDLYAQHIAVENCLFHDLGQSAVMMIGYGPGTKDVNKYNRVYNNHIHHCGQIYWHSQMITAFQSGHNYIGHNYVHHVPRKAVCITGVRDHFLKDGETQRRECVDTIRWDEIGDAITHQELLPFLHSRHNIIEYNEVHDVLQMLGDGSAINLSGCGEGNIVRFNYVRDNPAEHSTCGIRMDEDQTQTLIEKNIIVNMGVGGIVPKGENMIRNNFIIQACTRSNAGFIRALGYYGLSSIQRNILYNTNPGRHFYTRTKLDDYSDADIGRIDHNLYYCPETSEADWKDLASLKSKGADRHSVFADPMFADWENGDFTLRDESPALMLGIEQIDITPAGLTDEFPDKWRTH